MPWNCRWLGGLRSCLLQIEKHLQAKLRSIVNRPLRSIIAVDFEGIRSWRLAYRAARYRCHTQRFFGDEELPTVRFQATSYKQWSSRSSAVCACRICLPALGQRQSHPPRSRSLRATTAEARAREKKVMRFAVAASAADSLHREEGAANSVEREESAADSVH
jgi:hypothetical protein